MMPVVVVNNRGVSVMPIVTAMPGVRREVGGVGIARSEVLTIRVRIILRAITGIFDHGLRQRRRCQRGRGKRGGADPSVFQSFSPRLLQAQDGEVLEIPPMSNW
jgi:hypothetical protein